MTATFTIPEASPSLNRYAHAHWRVESNDKKRWMLMLLARSRGVSEATGKRRLTVARHGVRKLDHDNFVGGLKGCIDCLRKLHLLVDDNEAGMELVCEQLPLSKGDDPHTTITLTDLGETP